MNMKILAPAGDMESLRMAVYNGADEVYLGVTGFNARNIEGFSLETLKEAVEFSHIFDVKVNLTVNILFKDDEMQSAVDLIVDAYNIGVDSFIIQDVGLMSIIHINYPEIEMHASTQMGIHNLEGVKQLEKLGVKRVVLSRETSLDEIKRIKDNSQVEIEYFCQGALCVSFSGNCYLSSYLHNASGNRGKCKQLCRLPYSLRYENKEIKNGFLLSAKDFNMLNHLDELMNAGVDVLKIEGRARRPYYVGIATKIYKQAISNENYNIEDLMLGFNRDYTAGYFDGNGAIISNRHNHIGICVGKVEKFKTGKKFNEIFISSDRPIFPKSVLKFFVPTKNHIRRSNETKDLVEEIVVTAYDIKRSGDYYKITTTQTVPNNAEVNLVLDYEKEQSVLTFKTRRKFDINIVAKVNESIKAEFKINGETFEVFGDVCLRAERQPLTLKDLKTNFNKSELFEAELNAELENVFLTKKQLNEFRRKVFNEIKHKLILIKNKKIIKNSIINPKKDNKINKFNNFYIIFDDFNKILENNIEEENIIYSPSCYDKKDINNFKIMCEKKYKKAYLNLPIFALKEDIKMLEKILNETNISIIVNNFYALNFKNEKIIGGGMNIFNSYSANYFNLPFIQAEGDNFKMPYMTLRHCPMKSHLNTTCENCSYRDGYEYVMPNGKRFKLRRIKMSTCSFELTD